MKTEKQYDKTSEDKKELDQNEQVTNSLKLNRLPESLGKSKITEIVQKNMDEDIYKGLTNIVVYDMPSARGSNRYAVISFENEKLAARAKTIFENLDNLSLTITYCPGKSDTKKQAIKTPSKTPNKNSVPEKKKKNDTVVPHKPKNFLSRVLTGTNLPVTWSKQDVKTFIADHTTENMAIIKGLLYVYIQHSNTAHTVCHILFEQPYQCRLAKKLLLQNANRTIDGVTIIFDYDPLSTEIEWTNNKSVDTSAFIDYIAKKGKDRMQNRATDYPAPVIKEPIQHAPFNNSHPMENPMMGDRNIDFSLNTWDKPTWACHKQEANDSFGLNIAFLQSLGLHPPLTPCVNVDNVSKDLNIAPLRQIFGRAGTVVDLIIVSASFNLVSLKVIYEHPVEAVQAISMFHGQMLYGIKLIVSMDYNYDPDDEPLPMGLQGIGPGLRSDGLPLRNVKSAVEINKAINTLTDKIDELKHSFDELRRSIYDRNALPQTSADQSSVIQNSLSSLVSTLSGAQHSSLLALSALLNPQAAQVLQLLQKPPDNASDPSQPQMSPAHPQPQNNWNTAQNRNMPTGYGQGPQNPDMPCWQGSSQQSMAGPQMPGGQGFGYGENVDEQSRHESWGNGPPNAPYRQGDQQDGPRGFHAGQDIPTPGQFAQGGPEGRKEGNRDPCSVDFAYLPPSVSLSALRSKMLEVGRVLSAEMTGRGRATVTFATPKEAYACYKLLNGTKVDGQVIEVRHN